MQEQTKHRNLVVFGVSVTLDPGTIQHEKNVRRTTTRTEGKKRTQVENVDNLVHIYKIDCDCEKFMCLANIQVCLCGWILDGWKRKICNDFPSTNDLFAWHTGLETILHCSAVLWRFSSFSRSRFLYLFRHVHQKVIATKNVGWRNQSLAEVV